MTTNDIRKKFLAFFASKEHKIITSDSLVPKDDPTVLFTTAGMQQFKKQFLGQTDGLSRVTTSQKCLRTDDLDRVGVTAFHHTFFEMLGNFSFGNYFKKEAIAWAWEFLTKVIGLDPKKLWVSVYHEDKEAKAIWLNDIKLDPKRIVELGDKSNFWPSEAKQKGPNGPCGPCSEIFYDYGVDVGCKSPNCDPDCSCGRFAEIWNLVFTQYNRQEDGTLKPLPNKNIDTGMGLERLAAVVQGKKTNFDIDLFEPIFKAIDEHIKLKETTIEQNEKYILADHIRAIVFGICDGVVPSNTERGYIIKKLIITASDISIRCGGNMTKPSVFKLVPSVVEAMGDAYPELKQKQSMISNHIKNTEINYIKLRVEKIPAVDNKASELSKKYENDKKNPELKENLGELLFSYHGTHGVTIGTLTPVVRYAFDKKWSDDEFNEVWNEGFNYYKKLMNQQREQSRASSKMTGDVFTASEINCDNMPKTIFVGYDQNECKAKVIGLFIDSKSVKKAQAPAKIKIILDKTPFYGESGGQVGDTGTLTTESTNINISQTNKISDIFIHCAEITKGSITVGDILMAKVDQERRLDIMRNHTATHLLQSALRQVLGDHVQQQGSLVTEDKLRFDFTHPKALTEKEICTIEDTVNSYVQQCLTVNKKQMSLPEAKREGALAFFAEKYHADVRVVTVDKASKELCGGTHLDNTGQIGIFKILNESAIAQGIRRIEATTGRPALKLIHDMEGQIEKIAKILKSPKEETISRLETQMKRMKDLEQELSRSKIETIKSSLNEMIEKAKHIGTIAYIATSLGKMDIDTLRKIADLIKQKAKSAIIALGAQDENGTSLIVCVTDNLIAKDIKANDIIAKVSQEINASGGGRPQLAQAGTKEKIDLNKTFQYIEKLIKEKNT
ncbi:MAG: alanine--tRNA ligase [Candidatus Omnitrophota bacterium]